MKVVRNEIRWMRVWKKYNQTKKRDKVIEDAMKNKGKVGWKKIVE